MDFKPFDRVLVRDGDGGYWEPKFYSCKWNNMHCMICDRGYYQCIPYEGNEHLCFTTDNPKGD